MSRVPSANISASQLVDSVAHNVTQHLSPSQQRSMHTLLQQGHARCGKLLLDVAASGKQRLSTSKSVLGVGTATKGSGVNPQADVFLSPFVSLVHGDPVVGSKLVVNQRTVPKGTTLARVPLKAALSANMAPCAIAADGSEGGTQQRGFFSSMTPPQALSYMLLRHSGSDSGGDSKMWSNFIRTFRNKCVTNAVFPGARLSNRLEEDEAMAARKQTVDSLLGSSPLMHAQMKQVGASGILWAAGLVSSRSTHLPPPYHLGIVPVVHWVNHNDRPTAALLGTIGALERPSVEHAAENAQPRVKPASFVSGVLAEGCIDGKLQITPSGEVEGLDHDLLDLVAIADMVHGDEVTITYRSPSAMTREEEAQHFMDTWGFIPDTLTKSCGDDEGGKLFAEIHQRTMEADQLRWKTFASLVGSCLD